MKSLWGDLPSDEGLTPPVTILKAQAEILTRHYQGMLEGQVKQSAPFGDFLSYDLFIVAPLLNNYTFFVVSLRNPITLYPCKLIDRAGEGEVTEAKNSEEVEYALGKVLSSDRVKDVIAALVAQSKT